MGQCHRNRKKMNCIKKKEKIMTVTIKQRVVIIKQTKNNGNEWQLKGTSNNNKNNNNLSWGDMKMLLAQIITRWQ